MSTPSGDRYYEIKKIEFDLRPAGVQPAQTATIVDHDRHARPRGC